MSKFTTVLSIVLLVVIVGGITWLTQFLPSRGIVAPLPPVKGDERDKGKEVLSYSRPEGQFGTLHGIWERDASGKETPYMLENENGVAGYYDFPFRNVLGAPAEMELLESACDCSSAEVCVLPDQEWQKINAVWVKTPWIPVSLTTEPTWHQLTGSSGVKIPEDGRGLLRVHWRTRNKAHGHQLNINLKFWSQPEGKPGARRVEQIYVPVVVAQPIMVEPPRYQGIVLGSGAREVVEFYYWSGTRDDPKVSFQPREADPLFTVESRPLSADECRQLQDAENQKLGGPRYRVHSGFKVTATLYEQKGNQQMDQGPFARTVPIIVDGDVVDYATPLITGVVRGEVEVGAHEDQGKVQLKTFARADGRTITVPLYADPRFAIKHAGHTPEVLQVELLRNDKGSTSQRAQWNLKVTVAPNTWSGPMPENAHILLKVLSDPPRNVRIPVVGTATR
jgi:hypothetical protein